MNKEILKGNKVDKEKMKENKIDKESVRSEKMNKDYFVNDSFKMSFLREFFVELFNVNCLMLDLMCEIEEKGFEYEILLDFYIQTIKDEFSNKDKLVDYAADNSVSCLNSLSDEELDKFAEAIGLK